MIRFVHQLIATVVCCLVLLAKKISANTEQHIVSRTIKQQAETNPKPRGASGSGDESDTCHIVHDVIF